MLGHVNSFNTGFASEIEHCLISQFAPNLWPEEHLHLTATVVSRSDLIARTNLLKPAQETVTKFASQNSQKLPLYTATSANKGDTSCCASPSKNWRCQISKLTRA